MQNNMIVYYVDAHTGVILDSDEFYDPDLKWVFKKGQPPMLYKSWGCGRPTEEWLRNNPITRIK